MRNSSDTDLPVADTETAPADTDSSSRNTVLTYPTCFQAFPNHHNSISDIEKKHFHLSKKALSMPENTELSSEKSIPSSKTPTPIIENFKKIIHLRNNRTQNHVI